MDDRTRDAARFAWGAAVGSLVMSPFILFLIAAISPELAIAIAAGVAAVAGALVIHEIIHWMNWRHDRRQQKPPPDYP